MAGNDEVKIKIRTELDKLGAEQAKKVLKEIQAEAANTDSRQGGVFAKTKEGIQRISAGVKMLNRLVAGLGIVGLLMRVAGLLKEVYEWINKGKAETEKLAGEARKLAEQKTLDGLKRDWEELREKIDKTSIMSQTHRRSPQSG